MSITANKNRVGNFTSSEIVALTSKGKQAEGFGVAAMTYISEKRMERLMGCPIGTESNAKPLVWGKSVEPIVHRLLPLSYTYCSDVTDSHPTISTWAGSKDGTNEAGERAVIDIKCPMTHKSFCQFAMPLVFGMEGNEAMDAIRNGFEKDGIPYEKHKDGEKYYWQLVSNAIINDTKFAELIVYMPYQSELSTIRQLVEGRPECYWISFSEDSELPSIPDNGIFKNLNIIRFEVPLADKDFLTRQVIKASKLLLPPNETCLIAHHDASLGATIVEKA